MHRRTTFDTTRRNSANQQQNNRNDLHSFTTEATMTAAAAAASAESLLLRHVRARLSHPAYDACNAIKQRVPDAFVDWSTPWPEYAPIEFTHPRILEQPPYADPVDAKQMDWSTRRFSLEYARRGLTEYVLDERGRPRNIVGRTGMTGRGRMGKWGPNQAADGLVTRRVADSDPPVFEFVAIQRSDTGIWALPGGMVDASESFRHAAIREFFEEAGTEQDMPLFEDIMEKEGVVTYAGAVDDNRATDNAWTETSVLHWVYDASRHPPLRLKAADDAIGVGWLRTNSPTFHNPDTFHCHHRILIMHALGLLNAETIGDHRPSDWFKKNE
jgi:ADP-ribose pyrophosphatase